MINYSPFLQSRAQWRRLAAFGSFCLGVFGLAIGLAGAFAQTNPPSQKSDACGPSFSKDGPAAEAYGLSENYQLGTIRSRDQQNRMVASYSNFDKLLPFHTVSAPARASLLKRDCNPPDISYRLDGVRYTLDDYLARNPVTGLLIARGNTILVERYQYDRKDTDRFVSQSMVKTMVGMLVGIALDEGKIHSLDDAAQDYLPQMKGSAYGGTALRALLTMSSGVAFTETYDGTDDSAQFARNLRRTDLPDAAGLLAQYNTREVPPETAFHYAGPQTEILGLVIAAVMKKQLSDVLAERIWKPIGAEADAAWSVDAHGQELAFCCLSARLRDFARFGMLLARNGDGIIPASWIAAATSAPDESFRAPRKATAFFGYGYQTWIFPTQRRIFAMLGIHGQVVFVDPESQIVMAQTAVRLKPNKDPMARETSALWFGVLRSLGAAAALR